MQKIIHTTKDRMMAQRHRNKKRAERGMGTASERKTLKIISTLDNIYKRKH